MCITSTNEYLLLTYKMTDDINSLSWTSQICSMITSHELPKICSKSGSWSERMREAHFISKILKPFLFFSFWRDSNQRKLKKSHDCIWLYIHSVFCAPCTLTLKIGVALIPIPWFRGALTCFHFIPVFIYRINDWKRVDRTRKCPKWLFDIFPKIQRQIFL